MAKSIRKFRSTASRQRRIAYLRGKLLEKRSKLLARIASDLSAIAESGGHARSDTGDMAYSSLELDTHYETGSQGSRAVAEIDDALRKIEDGTYGVCEECGRRISAARLRAVPFALLCVACKEREEKEDRLREERFSPWDESERFLGEDDLKESFVRLRGRRVG